MTLLRRLLLATSLLGLLGPGLAEAQDPINAIIGDASWRARYGTAPDGARSAQRIRVHLAFVERLLRAADLPRLTPTQRAQRTRALDALAAYRRAGVFPRRTDDGFVGRRPRFIDDRGVHCAVGQMIAATGHPGLARAIDARFEYAYVEAIDEPGLAVWAKAHGFTTEELAMVQPGYDAPPTPESLRAQVEAAKDGITLECARHHEPPSRIHLRARSDRDGTAHFRSRSGDPFVRCFVDRAQSLQRGGGAYDVMPTRFRTRMRIQIERPQAILERRLAALGLDADSTSCVPRPGPIPERVFARVKVGAQGLSVTVRPEPANREVALCLVHWLEERLGDFGPGRWRLEARLQRRLGPRVATERLQRMVESYAPNAATECWDRGASERARVRVDAARDAEAFAIEVEGGSPAYGRCVSEGLQEQLRQRFATSRQLPDGSYERYFRIDGDATATHSFDVESPAERAARVERMREAIERERMDDLL